MNLALECFTRNMEILVEKVCRELIPPLKWSSWEIYDIVQSLDEMQTWYSTLIDSITGLSSQLKACMKECDMPGICTSWTYVAQKATLEVRAPQKFNYFHRVFQEYNSNGFTRSTNN